MNLPEIQSLLTSARIYLSQPDKNSAGDLLLGALVPATETLLAGTGAKDPAPVGRYRVTGDHPILARQDRVVATKHEADIEVDSLKQLGYGVKVVFVDPPKTKSQPLGSLRDVAEYEILGAWWAGFVPKFLSGVAARYINRKTKKKLTRFLYHKCLIISQSPATGSPKAQTFD